MPYVATSKWPIGVPGGGLTVVEGDVVPAESWANRNVLIARGWIALVDGSQIKDGRKIGTGLASRPVPNQKSDAPKSVKKPRRKATSRASRN